MLESFGAICAIGILIVGLALSVHFYSTRGAIATVSISTALCLAPLFFRILLGIEAPSEPLQVNSGQVAVFEPIPADEYSIADVKQAISEEEFISIKALVIVGAIPFAIGLLFVIVHSPGLSSVFERSNNNESEINNQVEHGDELTPIIDHPTSKQVPLSHTSQSVGSLKSTRKIQLD